MCLAVVGIGSEATERKEANVFKGSTEALMDLVSESVEPSQLGASHQQTLPHWSCPTKRVAHLRFPRRQPCTFQLGGCEKSCAVPLNVCCGITRLWLGVGVVMGLVGSHGEDPLQARNAVQVRGTAGRSRGTLGDGAGAFVSLVSHQRNRIIIPLPTKIQPPVSKTLSLYPAGGRRTRHSAALIYTNGTGETQDYTSNGLTHR